MRADEAVSKALNISRSKASALIKEQKILLNDEVLTKPARSVDEGAKISCLEDIFVSRGALKLKAFLESSKLSVSGKSALDIGSSTGGFAQILLRGGVRSLACVDVGSAQLDDLLRSDERVEVYENTDIREFSRAGGFDLVTADISFVSLLLILPSIKKLVNDDIIMLFKPQFEVGKEAKRDKKGVVKDEKAIRAARARFEKACAELGFVLISCAECQIKGKNGNQEIFYHYKNTKN